jgi:hypothetical protein
MADNSAMPVPRRRVRSPIFRDALDWDYEGISNGVYVDIRKLERERRQREVARSREVARYVEVSHWLVWPSTFCIINECGGERAAERIYCESHVKIARHNKQTDSTIAGILAMYETGWHTTAQVAARWCVSTRAVQRLANQAGIMRTAVESWLLSREHGHWDYHRLPASEKKVCKQVRPKLRYEIISAHPYCTLCGNRASETIRLEVDHIDKNPSNSELSNLQVLCNLCNIGKGG